MHEKKVKEKEKKQTKEYCKFNSITSRVFKMHEKIVEKKNKSKEKRKKSAISQNNTVNNNTILCKQIKLYEII